ncbi:MAG: hypothetical protein M1830_002919 [Pleopsidium flavum]|nr:MAG: hypothetical protein M1830_002919 [Pleopsidium flavum]
MSTQGIYALFVHCLLHIQIVQASMTSMMVPLKDGNAHNDNLINLSLDWEVLGPFQIGTREATWGADPLEDQGGFRALEYDAHAEFRSSLPSNGTVRWSRFQSKEVDSIGNASKASLTVSFPAVDWSFLQSVYGWAALQFQAWARGTITINADQTNSIVLYVDNVLEFWVDGKSYFGGDFYSYRRAPLILHLEPGHHRLDVRLIRDVRAMGGTGEPNIQVRIEAHVSSGGLTVVDDKLLFPDIVDGKLSSTLASVPVRNEGSRWIQVLSVESVDDLFFVSMLENGPFSLAPGQTRPLAFNISLRVPMAQLFSFRIQYVIAHVHGEHLTSVISLRPTRLSIYEPHKFTFLHSGGIVSYAILRPPSPNITSLNTCPKQLPILLNLHGAGLEADSDQVRHSLDVLPDLCTWVLFPTGVTPWSGDDWHTWGFADVEAAVAAIPEWIAAVSWNGPSVDINRWLVGGHSNGGQGTWYALTHQPDKIVAAAPVSGYSSIQKYIPYSFWHEADPRLTSIIHASMNSYRHELLVENFAGIPVLQQHGSADDNVPAYHSRRLNQLISQYGGSSQYVELPKLGHWFDGVMTTAPLRGFYEHYLDRGQDLPELPMIFSIVIANPGDMGSRGGIMVDQLMSPDQYGRIHVERTASSRVWILKTCNILRFHVSHLLQGGGISLQIDESPDLFLVDETQEDGAGFRKSRDGIWRESDTKGWPSVKERHGRQLGALNALLSSQARFSVVTNGDGTHNVALQISRNLFQYYAADSTVVDQIPKASGNSGNVINVLFGPEPKLLRLDSYPISIEHGSGISIRDASGVKAIYAFEKGLGAVFLRPMPEERLELVIWGLDESGLRQAARLVPMLTGVGQGDFVIVSKRCLWTGVQGALAMGFLDHTWNVTKASYLA